MLAKKQFRPAALVVILGAVGFGCTQSTEATPTPANVPNSSPIIEPSAERTPFTSDVYPYSISYPSNWQVKVATRELGQFQPPHEFVLETDYFAGTAPDQSYPGVVVAAPHVDVGTTLDEWVSRVEEILLTTGCGPPVEDEDIELGGEPARLLYWPDCNEYILWAAAVHGGRGFHVFLSGAAGLNEAEKAENRAFFEETLDTFRFTE